jgi:hypothetical protein
MNSKGSNHRGRRENRDKQITAVTPLKEGLQKRLN